MLVEIDVPEWAKYMAQDACGDWWFYERRPTHDIDTWGCDRPYMYSLQLAYTSAEPKDFTQELYEVY